MGLNVHKNHKAYSGREQKKNTKQKIQTIL